MDQVEVILVSLLVSVTVLSAAARAINVPYPIVLVIGGALLGLLPGLPETRLDPDLVLVIFLPPLLYSSAFFANLRDLRANLRAISLLSIGLVLATVLVVAWVAHALIDGLSRPAAFALGAIVGPTDPVAATAIASRLGVPRRIVSVLEGESLVNDATALVAYKIALAAAAGAGFSLLDAGWDFLWKASGGIAVGLAVGWVIAQVRKRIEDPLVENTIGLLSGYAAYVPAEHLQLSAVLAAVTVGIYVGWQAPKISSPSTRLQGYGMWELLVFLMNAFLFVLIGLQLPLILDGLDTTHWTTLVGYGAAISAAVVLTRLVWQNTIVYVIRALDRRESQRARRVSWRMRMVGGWAGMRGAVSLAVALALPLDFPKGAADGDQGRAGADRGTQGRGLGARRHARSPAAPVRIPQAAARRAGGKARGRRVRGPVVHVSDYPARGVRGAAGGGRAPPQPGDDLQRRHAPDRARARPRRRAPRNLNTS
jgi:Na+/H+ antiporter